MLVFIGVKHLDAREISKMKLEKTASLKSFMTCIFHQMLLRQSNQEGWDKRECYKYVRD
jgi:hypothetical protein